MNRQLRGNFIARRLNELYPQPRISLVHGDPFTLLIAVVLSAQCTDARVNQVTPALFKRARTPSQMARLGARRIEPLIRRCGLAPGKSRSIAELSQILIDRFSGKIPQDFAALESLPGVGHKTASVVMSQAFGIPAFPVDTHVHRLAQRWRLTSGKSVRTTESDLKHLFPREHWNQLHLQFIYFGREHCTARGCDGTICEICATCFPGRAKPVATRKA